MALQSNIRVDDLHGLSDTQWDRITEVLRRRPLVTGAILYGSRAKGCHSPHSDVDLVLEGELDELTAASVASELDELPMPYKFDVQALSTITFQPLLEHIARVGIRVNAR